MGMREFKWEQDRSRTADGVEALVWYQIKTDLFWLVVRPLSSGGFDYRVQMDGPTKPHAVGGEVCPTVLDAQAACIKTAVGILRRSILELEKVGATENAHC